MSVELAAIAVGAAIFGAVIAGPAMRAIEDTPPDPEDDPAPVPRVGPYLARRRLLPPLLAVVGAVVALRTGVHPEVAAHVVVAVGLIVLSVIDLDLFLLPKRIVFPLMGATAVLLGIAAAVRGDWDLIVRSGVCAVAAFAALAVLWLINPKGMGYGDVRLAGLIGLDLGWIGGVQVMVGIFAGFVIASVVGIGLMATRRAGRRDAVPFGPFLAAGTLFVLMGGDVALGFIRH